MTRSHAFFVCVTIAAIGAGGAQAQNPFGTEPIEEGRLARETAREDVNQASMADQRSGVANNSINGDSATGTIAIDNQAFQNMSGLSVLNANTGNNVAINASMQVNIAMTPGL